MALLTAGCTVTRTAPPAPVMNFGTKPDSASGSVIIQRKDTLYALSQRYRLPMRDIIDLNNLQPPYNIPAGTRLKLPAPREHRVGNDDTVNSISRMYNASPSEIVRLNNLPPPYKLKTGMVLRLPGAEPPSQLASNNNPAPMPVVRPAPVYAAPLPHAKVEAESLAAPSVSKTDPPAARMAETAPAQTFTLPTTPPNFSWPIRGRILSSYGPKEGQLFNDGINIAAPKGTAVQASADGIVAYVGNELSSYGNLVLIRHGGGLVTAYAHMSNITVTKGMVVRKGQSIGTVGSTGKVANTQLHFEIRRGTQTIDPRKYLG